MLQNNIDTLECERVEKESVLVSTQWKLQRLMEEVELLMQDKQSIQMQLYQSQQSCEMYQNELQRQAKYYETAIESYREQLKSLESSSKIQFRESFSQLIEMVKTCKAVFFIFILSIYFRLKCNWLKVNACLLLSPRD